MDAESLCAQPQFSPVSIGASKAWKLDVSIGLAKAGVSGGEGKGSVVGRAERGGRSGWD